MLFFCVASYHFGRDALRVTVDGSHDIGREIGCQARGRQLIETHRDRQGSGGNGRDDEGHNRQKNIFFHDDAELPHRQVRLDRQHALSRSSQIQIVALATGLSQGSFSLSYGTGLMIPISELFDRWLGTTPSTGHPPLILRATVPRRGRLTRTHEGFSISGESDIH